MDTMESPKAKTQRPRSRKSIAHMPSPDTVNKENTTVDSATLVEASKASHKKSRSKSIGPGGLDALKETTGNRRDATAAPFVKSILKPTIAHSPPKQIPPHPNARRRPQSPRKQPPSPIKSPRKRTPESQRSGTQEGMLIDTSDGINGATSSDMALPNPFSGSSLRRSGAADLSSLSQPQTLVAVRTEEEQQKAAVERERRERENARKDARRKSLANRRVSFAPDATLHTWEVVELPEDSTTSSASGNSTRRASALSSVAATSPRPQPRSPLPGSDASEPPSTPPAQVEEPAAKVSPAPQRDLHQKKHRRSSGIPPMNFNNPEEFSSSPSSGGSVNSEDTGNQAFVTADEADSSDSDDKDLVEDESTVRVDDDDVTARSALSAQSSGGSSTASSGRLDEALRQAAKQAGTQGIEYDEHGEITMEMADDEITNAFQPWMKNGKYVPQAVGNPSALQDQENVNPFSPEFRSSMRAQHDDTEGGATMEFTQAAGSILPVSHKSQGSPEKNRRRSNVNSARRSIGQRRRSSGASSTYEDETMDFTAAVGGIEYNGAETKTTSAAGPMPQMSDEEDEELTMDFTTVLGGVLGQKAGQQQTTELQTRRESIDSSAMDEDMDITFAAGGILPSITERTEPPEDQTMEMDVTQAVGAILPKALTAAEKTRAKTMMEQETDVGQLPMDPFYDGPASTTPGATLSTKAAIFKASATRTSESGSPSKRDPSKSPALMIARQSLTPKMGSRQTTPLKKISTPSKQLTPQVGPRPTTPGKTPPSKNIALRTGSPKKLFQKETGNSVTSPKAVTKNPIFEGNGINGFPTAQIVLKPRRRRSSGLGADKEGLGSPRVTELLDRRGSIHQSAQTFVSNGPAPTGVRFEDPRVMENELENERAEEERRQSGRGILQMEADSQDAEEQKDATTTLKDRIESLTPQKKKAKPRKSLHVGAAKGILGKRPAELDVDEDEDGTSPQNVMGRQGSPVKKVKLPAPPSKNETTRRHLRSARPSLVETLGNNKMNTPSLGTSPSKGALMTTPQGQARFKDVSDLPSAEKPMASFEEKLQNVKPTATEPVEAEDRIHLQDFLNMTSIRFMELTTTKRRLTVAPNALESSAQEASTDLEQSSTEALLEKSIVAGACTVPMLELYQHSCRELKRYIAEGRSIVREIEADTYEDNPALFREYMTAPPEAKALMDNQFKNVKTHARLLSKAMWYEWRMKLLEGLREGLVQIRNGMDEDAQVLSRQEGHVEALLPKLIEENERLQNEHRFLQAQADELASCDQDELRQAREQLATVDQDLQAKRRLADELEQELQAKEQSIQDAVERRDEYHAEIKEAERVRQESRGWKTSEVAALQENVAALEETYGWKIISATGSALTMTYKDSLQLYFTPSSFVSPSSSSSPPTTNKDNSPISLTYIADTHEHQPKPLTTEKRFFLQIIRAQLQCLTQSSTSTSDLLGFVSRNWDVALTIAEEVRALTTQYITTTTILSDEVMNVQAVLLLPPIKTKLSVSFQVQARGAEGEEQEEGIKEGLEVAVRSDVRVVYGEGLKEGRMREWVDGRLKEEGGERGGWVRCVGRLEEKIKGRGKR
ncbi:MAG: hypothetical protein LQ339_000483 [Xanthoria mediterranea]|nr:MAG: hypothetical protein LQ339_000483 [Xanthoria mediterranea]